MLYDAAEMIGMASDGGFLQLVSINPSDESNPIFLFSFDWAPTTFDERTVDWMAAAGEGAIYIGDGPAWTWEYVQLQTIGSTSGSFRVVPGPGTAAALGVGVIVAAGRRRRVRV